MDDSRKRLSSTAWLGLIWLAGFVLFLYGRYGAGTAIYWHADDWTFNRLLASSSSLSEAMRLVFPHPDRFLGYPHIFALYTWANGDPLRIWWVSVVGYALVLAGFMGASWVLTRSYVTAFTATILFVCWPNLTEHFHWPNILSGFAGRGLWGIVGSLLAWACFVRTRRRRWYGLALLGYAYGLAFGEIAAPLPGALVFLMPWRDWRKAFVYMLPFAGILAFYIIYRFSNAFGYGVLTTYGEHHFQIRPTLFMLYYQGSEFASRWVGVYMLENLADGWRMLLNDRPLLYRSLIFGNLLVAIATGWSVRKLVMLDERNERPYAVRAGWPIYQLLLFAGVWVFLFFLPIWVAHNAPRMAFIPSIGVSLAVALLVVQWGKSVLPVVLGIWCFIALGANQGTNLAWQEVGRYNHGLYERLVETRDEWIAKEVIVLDSARLRERHAHRLTGVAPSGEYALARYFNASFIWWHYFPQLVQLAALPEISGPRAILDILSNPRWEEDVLHWHIRFNPAAQYTTDRDKVYVLDMGP